ncbi:MAG: glucosaminidase domain-containing protein [Kouleothrix sp.]|nr:glucosaminidase domain-containing protein [Kouleothrix sp.]
MLGRPHGDYDAHAITNVIVPGYLAVCAAGDVDPLLALAQLIHETGCLSSWWSQRPRRNPAGIGVTGRTSHTRPPIGTWEIQGNIWVEGRRFDTWAADAIPAHVGRLLAYALPEGGETQPQRRLIGQALSYRRLPGMYRGIAPTWGALGGTWAVPGNDYGDRLADIARAIMHELFW